MVAVVSTAASASTLTVKSEQDATAPPLDDTDQTPTTKPKRELLLRL